MYTDLNDLAKELVEGLETVLPTVLAEDNHGIYSICILGSYARGDFIPGNSDLDFQIIWTPGRECAGFPYPSQTEPGFRGFSAAIDGILAGRKFRPHWECPTFPFEWLPTTPVRLMPFSGPYTFRYFNIFLFDYIKNLKVLWGNDPRPLLTAPPSVRELGMEWFERRRFNRDYFLKSGELFRIPFSVFISIQIAQIIFGEQTIDKRYLLDLYEKNVPEFPMKDFGAKMIRDKNAQTVDCPCQFALTSEYCNFEDQLFEVVKKELQQ